MIQKGLFRVCTVPNGSPFGDPGSHDLFGDLGPFFMFWVPFFSILD